MTKSDKVLDQTNDLAIANTGKHHRSKRKFRKMQSDQFKMDRIITTAALPCMRKQQDKRTTSIETLLLRLTAIQTSLNTNITRTDNNAH